MTKGAAVAVFLRTSDCHWHVLLITLIVIGLSSPPAQAFGFCSQIHLPDQAWIFPWTYPRIAPRPFLDKPFLYISILRHK
jgi:hypothetical protein